MASEIDFVEFVVQQMESAGEITYKKMFGEYGLYCDGTIMALVCDDQLSIKPTEAGRSFIKKVNEAPPYPGAKPYLLIEDQLDDREWISSLVKQTVKELSKTEPKTKRKKK
ncbi:MAG: TfoX/Sxy family protein [Kiritimatiellae bacterium]|nr:TfoX/Sxy family protein [Kiritimatiellia bacterium]